ncbi:MAG TPA: branched-chain amino acid ABC transporter permease [Syntrophorhabdaceae bacterium]|nr:branched-chain amino acid ABC transporter permease [Syntrophorhabdaceae bacterium]HNT69329.1 branched-chain amino acid ABC transporter permease [Syntrophorhabdaceae bacterium]
MDISQIIQFTFSGLTLGSIYALMAVSLSIVYKVSRVISFAQGEFFVFGALTMITLTGIGVWAPLAFALSVLMAALLGSIIEQALIRPVLKTTLGTVITMTIAISLALRGLALLLWGRGSHTSATFSSGEPIRILDAALQIQVLWIVGVTGAALLLIWLFFEKTMLGIAIRASADNPVGASLVGISIRKVNLLAWSWGSGLGAVAGMVVAPLYFLQYGSGVLPMVNGFIAIAISGLKSIPAAVVAGFFLGFVEAYSIGFVSSQFSEVIVFTVLIVVLQIRSKAASGAGFDEKGM